LDQYFICTIRNRAYTSKPQHACKPENCFQKLNIHIYMSSAELSILESQILSSDRDITKKYRALFTLRNIATPAAAGVLEKCLLQTEHDEGDRSALLKHEVAYALGQIGLASSLETLSKVLADATCHPMVRHEVQRKIVIQSIHVRTHTHIVLFKIFPIVGRRSYWSVEFERVFASFGAFCSRSCSRGCRDMRVGN
jgi:hypothetical protein